MFNTLKSKITFFSILISITTGLVFSVYSFIQSREHLIESKIIESQNRVNIFSKNIQSKIEEVKGDVLFLSATPPIRGILRSDLNNGIDPIDNSSLETWKHRLEVIFNEMLYVKNEYLQIRYIGSKNDGKEVVRVERQGLKTIIVTEQDMQKKGQEKYFLGASKTNANKVYLSSFSLNREYGKVTYPLQMVIRAAVPIYEKANKVYGIVIINIDYSSIFKNLEINNKSKEQFFILDKNKKVLLNSENKNNVFKQDINNNTPEIINKYIQSTDSNSDNNISTRDNNIYIKKKLRYNDANPNDYLDLYLILNKTDLYRNVEKELLRDLILLIILSAISLIFAYSFSNKITAPIKKLMLLTNEIIEGKEIDFKKFGDKKVSKDEVSTLTTTLLEMSKNVYETSYLLEGQKKALDSAAIVTETDNKGVITYVNDKLIDISKYSATELIGQDHKILNSGHHTKDFFKNLWDKILEGKVWSGEIKNKAKDGTYYWVHSTIYPSKDRSGKINKFITIRFDITEKKLAQLKIEEAKNEAQKALEVKSSFLANMSHEIRTPLNGILGFIDLIKDQELKPETEEYIDNIRDCSKGLMLIINDVLDISKIEAGKLSIEEAKFNLKETVESSLVMFKAAVKEKNIKLDLLIDSDVPTCICGDALRLRQIIINLVGNAVKFTDAKGSINVNIALLNQEEDDNFTVLLEVRDTGIGITKEQQKSLFNSFEQADSSVTRKYGGTGLGLSICAKLISLMGGKIWAESGADVGTSFFFTLKSKVVTGNAIEEKASADNIKSINSSIINMKILVVEDNLINQKVIHKMLNRYQQDDVTIAENGEEAIIQVKNNVFDLIFMDIQMPIMDGLTATKVIRNELNIETPIIGFSANVFSEDKDRAFEYGMNYFIEKPIKKNELAKILKLISGQILEKEDKAS